MKLHRKFDLIPYHNGKKIRKTMKEQNDCITNRVKKKTNYDPLPVRFHQSEGDSLR